MLPLVGVVAIGLLVVAGKLFFLSGIRPERGPVSTVREHLVVDSGETKGDLRPTSVPDVSPVMPEPMGGESSQPTVSLGETAEGKLSGSRRTSLAIDVLAIPYGLAASTDSGAKAKGEAGTSSSKSVPKRVEVVVSPSRKPVAAAPAPKPQVSSPPSPPQAPRKPLPNPVPAKRPTPPPSKPAPKMKTPPWLVQVGAFSSKEAANDVSRKLSQAGYQVSIMSGVRFHRVMVQAGPARQDAVALASRLDKDGFPGAFSVPPVSP